MALGLPVVMLILFGYALTLDVDRIPLMVLDQSRTPQSRELISKFQGSLYFHLLGTAETGEDIETAIVPNLRQKLLMEESLRSSEIISSELEKGTSMELIAIDLQEAIDSLGQILGTNVKVDILNQIFNRFCIGK